MQKEFDYIIIGSGIAGIHTAYRLHQQGKKVLVLEKESYVGGRMSTHKIKGNFVDFGAKFLIDNAYRNMVPLARELGVEPIPMDMKNAAIEENGTLQIIDRNNLISSILFYKGISFFAKIRFAIACIYVFLKYKDLDIYHLESRLDLDSVSIYDDFRNVAGKEAFDNIIETMSQNVLFFSTHDLSREMFDAMFSDIFKMKRFVNLPKGIGQLCQVMAEKVAIEYEIKVKEVKRVMEGGVTITACKNNTEVLYHAKHVVMAVPGNRVLDILAEPLPYEKEFFENVHYAGTVQVLCQGATKFFDKANFIWTLPSENSSFTTLGDREYHSPSPAVTIFAVALKERVFKELQARGELDDAHIQELIKKEITDVTNLTILYTQVWESATPKMYPGYVTHRAKFLKEWNYNGPIYFCGDYMENPSTEGALTSSIKLLKNIEKGIF